MRIHYSRSTAGRDKLTAEQTALNREYLLLKNEVKEDGQISKSVDSMLRQGQREQQARRAQDMEL